MLMIVFRCKKLAPFKNDKIYFVVETQLIFLNISEVKNYINMENTCYRKSVSNSVYAHTFDKVSWCVFQLKKFYTVICKTVLLFVRVNVCLGLEFVVLSLGGRSILLKEIWSQQQKISEVLFPPSDKKFKFAILLFRMIINLIEQYLFYPQLFSGFIPP